MIVRYLYILVFIFIANIGTAQDSYSSDVLHEFVEVYLSYKTEKKRNSELDNELFITYNVSPQRYRNIAKAALNNDPLTLNPNEEQLIQEIKKRNELLIEEDLKLLQQLCSKHEIPNELYNEILQLFKTNIEFQRSLKSYFDSYIKRLK